MKEKISASYHDLASVQVLRVLLQFLSGISNTDNKSILE